ncbi:hypothetical protein HDU76_000919 [Blyttiomyces sp. JEL0837]|nr:hypothetical protein HDU76_000919 [Blyttiomyces sp. JEL0837]
MDLSRFLNDLDRDDDTRLLSLIPEEEEEEEEQQQQQHNQLHQQECSFGEDNSDNGSNQYFGKVCLMDEDLNHLDADEDGESHLPDHYTNPNSISGVFEIRSPSESSSFHSNPDHDNATKNMMSNLANMSGHVLGRKESEATVMSAQEVPSLREGNKRNVHPEEDFYEAQGAYHDMLVNVMNECQLLRKANEELEASNRNIRLILDETESAFAKERKNLQQKLEDSQKQTTLLKAETEKRVRELEENIVILKSSNEQISSIRSTLEREKELDLLRIKKELYAEKELQLQELRQQMERERSEIAEKLRLSMRQQEFNLESQISQLKDQLTSCVHDAKVASNMREKEISQLKEQLATSNNDGKLLSSMREKEASLVLEINQLRDQLAASLKEGTLQSARTAQLHESYKQQLTRVQESIALRDREIQKLRQRLNDRDNMTLVDLLQLYPNQMTEYESQIRRSQVIPLQTELETLKLEIRRDNKTREDTYRMNIAQVTKEVKEQCWRAYDTAITKLRSDYESLESKCMEKLAKSQNAASTSITQPSVMHLKTTIEKQQVRLLIEPFV